MPEKVPVYKGCKPKWSNKKLKDCMSLKIAQYILSGFNSKEAVKKYGSKDSGGVLGDILGKALKLTKEKKKKK